MGRLRARVTTTTTALPAVVAEHARVGGKIKVTIATGAQGSTSTVQTVGDNLSFDMYGSTRERGGEGEQDKSFLSC